MKIFATAAPAAPADTVSPPCLPAGGGLQIQCYQCEETVQHDCSTPEFMVNCTANVQDTCQKEVLVKADGA